MAWSSKGSIRGPAGTQVQPDWDATTGMGEILNKPAVGTNAEGNKTVSTSEPSGTGSTGDTWYVVE